MNRISSLFQANRNEKKLSVYFTAGYPNLEDTRPILKALQEGGVHMVEVGIPFSDPMADGPVIQEAATQALRNGMSLRKLFGQLAGMREEIHIPVILMGYLNPIFQYGFERFCAKCKEVGVDGLIIPDLPFADYIQEYKPVADRYDLKMIMLITPETSNERIEAIDTHTNGFIYMVSSASLTGAQKNFEKQKDYFRRIEALLLRNPRLVGFGVSNKETYETACRYSDGAIIGSKFIQSLKDTRTAEEAVRRLLNDLQN